MRREDERKQIDRCITKTLEFFRKNHLDVERAVINRETGVVELDGIRMNGLCLIGTCPHCGQEAFSNPLYSLYDIGRELETFEPKSDHRLYECPAFQRQDAEPVQPSVEQKLADALADFLYKYGRQAE